MMFNKLTDAETERLDILAEELSEAIQAICKIKRHGYGSYNPDRPGLGSNRTQLEKELGDVFYTVVLMEYNKDLNVDNIESHSHNKGLSIGQYLHHNEPIPEEKL